MRLLPGLASLAFSLAFAFAKDASVVILATTDLHGYLLPYDYLSGRAAERGLAKIGTLIRKERALHPGALLVDCGDTIQGSALEGIYQNALKSGRSKWKQDPMMLAMNELGYDAMAVGNHEFNFGIGNLVQAQKAARFPWISANTEVQRGGGRLPFPPYIVKTVDGIKVAIIGITTPSVPNWEKPENYAGYRFISAKEGIERALRELRLKHRPDLVVLAAHSGLDRDLKTGKPREGEVPGENAIYQIVQEVSGIDAVIFGHTHQQVENQTVNGVLLTQPKNWGMSLARVEVKLREKAEGGWAVVEKTSRLIPVNTEVPVDTAVERIARPYHELAEKMLSETVSKAAVRLEASRSRVEDTAAIDAIHKVQLHYAKADVSFASSFNPRLVIPPGPVTRRQIAALYLYDNELYAIEGTGAMVKGALENAARYYNSCVNAACSGGPLINRNVIGFNYDTVQGVTYEVDLRRPAGDRIQNLKFKGQPMTDGQTVRIALNNYRAGGSGGYDMFRSAKVVWRSYEDIRDLMIRYYGEHPLTGEPDRNWRIVPESARAVLLEEAAAETARSGNQ